MAMASSDLFDELGATDRPIAHTVQAAGGSPDLPNSKHILSYTSQVHLAYRPAEPFFRIRRFSALNDEFARLIARYGPPSADDLRLGSNEAAAGPSRSRRRVHQPVRASWVHRVDLQPTLMPTD